MSLLWKRIEEISPKLDIAAALAGLLVGALVLWMFPSQRDLGVAIIIACILYLLLRNRIGISEAFSLKLSSRQTRLLNIAFWCLFTASIWLYQTQPLYHKPLAYFILLSLLAGIIVIETLCFEEGKGKGQLYLILLQILLLSATIRMGIFYEFPSLSGADSFFHANQVQYIVDTGFIPPFEHARHYAAYPVFHSVIAMTQVLTFLSLKNALFWSIGLYAIISSIPFYFVVQKVAGAKVGLMAVLLVNVSTNLIYEGAVNIIPATLVTGWFMLMFYLILSAKPEVKNMAVLIFLTIMVVVTHQLSTFIVLCAMTVLFLVAMGCRTLYHTSQRVSPSLVYLLLFTVMLISYWAGFFNIQTTGYSFFGRMVRNFLGAFSGAELGYAAGVDRGVQYSLLSNTLFDLGYLILLIAGIGGILRWLSSRDNVKFSIAGAAIVLFAVTYGTSALGLRTVIPGRWFPILGIFLAILASAYIFELARLIRPNLAKIAIFSLISLLTFFMITTPNVNKDNPFYAIDRAGRTHFKASEVSGISTLNGVYSGIIKTDGYYAAGIMRQLELNSDPKVFDVEYVNDAVEKDSGTLVVVREAIFEEPAAITVPRGRRWGERGIKGILDREFLERFKTSGYSLIYSNGEVTGYLAK